jgi:hypothetical protein
LRDLDVRPCGECNVRLYLSIPFTTLTTECGWAKVPVPGQTDDNDDAAVELVEGRYRIRAVESFLTDRSVPVDRDLAWVQVLQVEFPRFAKASANIDVFAAVLFDTAVTSVAYGLPEPDVGSILFKTFVGYPYQVRPVEPMSFNRFPGQLDSATISLENSIPATAEGVATEQEWLAILTPGEGECSIDGTYIIDGAWVLECTQAAVDANDCPEINDDKPVVRIEIDFSEFCPVLTESVQATATLVPEKENLLIEGLKDTQSNLFTLTVTSTQVDVQEIDIDRITLVSDEKVLIAPGNVLVKTLVIYDANTGTQGTHGIVINAASGNVQTFELKFYEAGYEIPLDSKAAITVEARAAVTFDNGLKKRAEGDSLGSQSAQAKLEITGGLAGSQTESETDSAFTVVATLVTMFVALLF